MINLDKYLKQDQEAFSGINIVPFTDVVLVLLIIFMIAAPGIARAGMDVSLPGSKTAGQSQAHKLHVTLSSKGQLYLEKELITGADLKIALQTKVQQNPASSVVLNADAAVAHGKVIEVLDVIRASGVRQIYVGTVRK
ncbi:MAG: biopolymer transporter ExbD [Leptospiraceae bacterium]|nr:biopolymer transporter ExbD [Leptospiraceae bacterium]